MRRKEKKNKRKIKSERTKILRGRKKRLSLKEKEEYIAREFLHKAKINNLNYLSNFYKGFKKLEDKVRKRFDFNVSD